MSSTSASVAALRTIRRSALYDLIITAPFATPWTVRWLATGLGALHDRLGLPGERPVLVGALAVLMANLMGSLVVVWSIVRLRAPSLSHGVADTAARGAFALWMAWALASGASPLLAGFLVAEVGWGVVQGLAVRRARYAEV
jgi:hypothetical protein